MASEKDVLEMSEGISVMTVPKNTLVIANTNGFHSRSKCTLSTSRMEIFSLVESIPLAHY